MRWFYQFLFYITGWKIEGEFPRHVKKYIVAVAPHTSNWDFVVGLAARSILRMQRAKYLGKSQLFKPPFGWFFRMLGGHPVDRSSRHDMVDQVVNVFNTHDEFILAMAPEGTRKKVEKLKTGFYYIALGAGVPIIPAGFDYKRRRIIIAQPFSVTGDFQKDMAQLLAFYKTITGKNPDQGLN
ncbi:MAG: lysophospholipid acyltransferase family protein [Cyclobacteriaceae bacterium]